MHGSGLALVLLDIAVGETQAWDLCPVILSWNVTYIRTNCRKLCSMCLYWVRRKRSPEQVRRHWMLSRRKTLFTRPVPTASSIYSRQSWYLFGLVSNCEPYRHFYWILLNFLNFTQEWDFYIHYFKVVEINSDAGCLLFYIPVRNKDLRFHQLPVYVDADIIRFCCTKARSLTATANVHRVSQLLDLRSAVQTASARLRLLRRPPFILSWPSHACWWSSQDWIMV